MFVEAFSHTAHIPLHFSFLYSQNMTEEATEEKQRRIQHIRNLFAFDLFLQHRFDESLKIFAELGTGMWSNHSVTGTLGSIKKTWVRILGCCVKSWARLFTIRCTSSVSCMNEYLAIDSGGYLYMGNLCALIVAWLNISQRIQNSVQLNKIGNKML